MHGHTWEVTAWWVFDGTDVLERQRTLVQAIKVWDHTVLPEELAAAEKFAEYIGKQTGCVEVWIWRAGERLGARWMAA